MTKKIDYFKNKDILDRGFRETIGSLGTTTVPGANQLSELKRKIREGIKHVELHLSGLGKGEFNKFDVPGKYGFEARRALMQLAKLNKQTLSVHASISIGDQLSFSGISGGKISSHHRALVMKEADETIKFAAETAKGGAVVFHVNDHTLGGEIETVYAKERENIFRENPEEEESILDKIENYKKLKEEKKEEAKKIEEDIKESLRSGILEKSGAIFVGDQMVQVEKKDSFIDFDALKNLSETEKNMLKNKYEVDIDEIIKSTESKDTKSNVGQDEIKRLNTIFLKNNLPPDIRKIKDKIFIEYENLAFKKILEEGQFNQFEIDKEYYEKLLKYKENVTKVLGKELENKYEIYKEKIEEIRKKEEEEKKILYTIRKEKDYLEKEGVWEEIQNIKKQLEDKYENEIEKLKKKLQTLKQDDPNAAPEREKIYNAIYNLEKAKVSNFRYEILDELRKKGIKEDSIKKVKDIFDEEDKLEKISQETYRLKYNVIGIENYQLLNEFDTAKENIEKDIKNLKKYKGLVESAPKKIMKKTASALGHLGLKALKYQLDLLEKAKKANDPEFLKKLPEEERRKYLQYKDYNDIDIEKNPLYVAPENMPAGFGMFCNLDELRELVIKSREEFANKLLKEEIFKDLRDKLGINPKDKNAKEKALKIAERHIAATFDNAHAGTYFKHFKPLPGESEESRWERFNKWLNEKAEKLAKEGIIRHIHFNDTTGVNDDHSLLMQGHLDLKDLQKRLRKAGVKEAFIVEAGGAKEHMKNAFSVFNVLLEPTGSDYMARGTSTVRDWMTVRRSYEERLKHDYGYGLGASLKFNRESRSLNRGRWSGVGFL